MRVLAAYIFVIVLWSTTPLAIKWSGIGPGWLFGVTARMCIGFVCVWLLLAVMRRPLPFQRAARWSYVAGAVQIYGCMVVTYWSSQFIPSGWLSVVFGLTPLLTALMAAVWLGEKSLTPMRLLSYGLGVGGLAAMFGSALALGPNAAWGIGGILLAAWLQAACSIWLKRLDARVPALAQVAGSLSLSLPVYLLTWGLMDGQWPESLPPTSLASIVYLGTIATTAGFALYFFVLKHLPATQVALITLISPVFSLLVGHAVDGEPVGPRVLAGTGLIVGALLLHEFPGRRRPEPSAVAPPLPKASRVKARRRRKR